MCDACFRFLALLKPICVRCAHERKTRARRRVSLGVFVALISLGGTWLFWTQNDSALRYGTALFLFACAGLVVGVGMAIHALRTEEPSAGVARRTASDDWTASSVSRGEMRRARVRRVIANLSPTISGRGTALATLTTMAVTAALFPRLLHKARWVEFELVLLAWWILGVIALSVLLYRRYQIEDDHFFQTPSRLKADGLGGMEHAGDCGCDLGMNAGCDGIVGAAVALAIGAVALLASLLAAWLVVELLIPLVFITFYVTTLAGIQRAARDRHDCEGNLLRSLRWAVTWATIYIAPTATTVWLLHRILPAGN